MFFIFSGTILSLSHKVCTLEASWEDVASAMLNRIIVSSALMSQSRSSRVLLTASA